MVESDCFHLAFILTCSNPHPHPHPPTPTPQVWKTRMGRFRKEGTVEAFRNVYRYALIFLDDVSDPRHV